MKKLKMIKKIIALVCILTVSFVTLPIGSFVNAETGVYLNISSPSTSSIKAGGSVSYTLYYTGDVANVWLDLGSVVLNGFTANKIITGIGNTRTITLTNVQGIPGSKSISVTGGTAIDSLGNLCNKATSASFTITAPDTISPVLNVAGPNTGKVYKGGSISYVANYSDNVGVANVWLDLGSIVFNGFTANKIVTGSGNSRTITLTDIQGTAGTKSISITGGTAVDAAGNLANSSTSTAFALADNSVADTIAPVLSISGPNANSVYSGGTITYTVNYSDNIGIANVWLDSGSIVLNGFTANKSISGSGNTRTITLTNVQGTEGNKSISITGGTAIDAAGNLANSATSAPFTLNHYVITTPDTIAPILRITGPSISSIYSGQTVTYIANYFDDIGIANIWLDRGSIVLHGFTANVRISGVGNSRTITLTNVQGAVGGNKYISITGGTAIDAAGNLCNMAISDVFTIKQTPIIPEDKPQTPPDNKPSDWIPNPNTGI